MSRTVSIKTLLIFMLIGCIVAIFSAIGFVYFGIYNVAAVEQHTQPVYDVLEIARKRSIRMRLEGIHPPDLEKIDYQVSGIQLYEHNCVQCHGAPGVAPDSFSLGMMPAPSAAAKMGAVRSPEELYWVIANGVKMSGMPGWAFRFSKQEHWQVVALLKHLPNMTSAEYRQLREKAFLMTEHATVTNGQSEDKVIIASESSERVTRAEQGKIALIQYNCGTCHNILGITASETYVGPGLEHIAQQSFIAGVLPNTRKNLIEFIRKPEKFKSNTLMPNLSVDKEDAEAMVNYLLEH